MIGVFDSGFGGLTVLKEFIDKNSPLSQYDYIYLGDNARAPYGDKSPEVIYKYTQEAVDFLFSQGCRLIIIACNTASANALRKIQQEFLPNKYPAKRVLGVVIPAVEAVMEELEKSANLKKENNKIGVIGTRHTIGSKAYEKEFKKRDYKLIIYSLACPLLVPLIEEGLIKKVAARMILKSYLRKLKEKKIKILILGCTHYSVLFEPIKKIMGKNVKVINSPQAVARKLIDYLARKPEIAKKISRRKKRKYYTTDNVDQFKHIGEKFLKEKIINIGKASF